MNVFVDRDAISSEIRNITTKKCGIIRKRSELAEARDRISEIMQMAESSEINDKRNVTAFNRAQVSLSIVEASIAREESVGAHFIEN